MSSRRIANEWIYIPLGLVSLPILYVLSVGPVAAVVLRFGWPTESFEIFYKPLEWLYDNTPIDEPLDWWLQLWGVD